MLWQNWFYNNLLIAIIYHRFVCVAGLREEKIRNDRVSGLKWFVDALRTARKKKKLFTQIGSRRLFSIEAKVAARQSESRDTAREKVRRGETPGNWRNKFDAWSYNISLGCWETGGNQELSLPSC